MWDWSRTVAERALAATWQSVRVAEPKPTVTDPEPWAAVAIAEPEDTEDAMASAGASVANGCGGPSAYCLAG